MRGYIIIVALISSWITYGQTITGKITDTSNSPIPGVSITIEGKKTQFLDLLPKLKEKQEYAKEKKKGVTIFKGKRGGLVNRYRTGPRGAVYFFLSGVKLQCLKS